MLTECRCTGIMPFIGKEIFLKNQSHIISQHTMPKIGIITAEVSRRYVGDEVIVVKFPDTQFDFCPLVVIFPNFFRRHVRLIVTDDLITPGGKHNPLTIVILVHILPYNNKLMKLCPTAHTIGERSTLNVAGRIKGFKGIIRHALLYPVHDVSVLFGYNLKEEEITFKCIYIIFTEKTAVQTDRSYNEVFLRHGIQALPVKFAEIRVTHRITRLQADGQDKTERQKWNIPSYGNFSDRSYGDCSLFRLLLKITVNSDHFCIKVKIHFAGFHQAAENIYDLAG